MQIINNILLYDSTTLLACNNKEDLIDTLKDYEIKFKCIDYDPKFKNEPNYICKDFIFDDVDISADIVVHFNVEKTYPIKYTGDVILIGDGENHTGDCFPINSIDDIIKTYKVKEVYDTEIVNRWRSMYYCVYGRM
jgi:hypothetical protein